MAAVGVQLDVFHRNKPLMQIMSIIFAAESGKAAEFGVAQLQLKAQCLEA